MNALSEFLLARIAEEREEVQAAIDQQDVNWWHSPERMMAELDAKQAIVETYERLWKRAEEIRQAVGNDASANARLLYAGIEMVIGYLAAPYASHPDYRAEWSA